jgi:hypothetical protein
MYYFYCHTLYSSCVSPPLCLALSRFVNNINTNGDLDTETSRTIHSPLETRRDTGQRREELLIYCHALSLNLFSTPTPFLSLVDYYCVPTRLHSCPCTS